ncbi:FkbM family methyltransferase [Amycolatopsis orientalis]|nr:FkbM family methyltransferase [Amycolatopsis orientalis]
MWEPISGSRPCISRGRVPAARIYAFEPTSASYRCLAENCARHAPGAHTANYAIGSSNREARLTYYPHRSTMSTLYVDDEEDRHNVRVLFEQFDPSAEFRANFWADFDRGTLQETVPMTTLADALSGTGIDEISFLKIDVERAELEVLNGLADDQWPKVRRLAIEVHDRNGRLAEIGELLDRRGYRVECLREEYFSGTRHPYGLRSSRLTKARSSCPGQHHRSSQ